MKTSSEMQSLCRAACNHSRTISMILTGKISRAVALLVVVTRVEGVDLGKFFFTGLEKFLLKLGIVPLNCILICDCKKIKFID